MDLSDYRNRTCRDSEERVIEYTTGMSVDWST